MGEGREVVGGHVRVGVPGVGGAVVADGGGRGQVEPDTCRVRGGGEPRAAQRARELRRGDAVLHIAGCDDRTAAASGVPGHGFDLDAVLVDRAARAGVDLQISGHTHGCQPWPVTQVELVDQPGLAGLARVGPTWPYVTRGTRFWGPPVRVGSPPEITLLTLRSR